MGSCSFFTSEIGTTANEAFQTLVDDAIFRHGNDSYNGTISTCDGFRVIKRFDVFKDNKAVNEEVDRLYEEYLNKSCGRDCFCIDRGIVKYVRKELKVVTHKAQPKYKTMYALIQMVGEFRDEERIIKTSESIKKLQEYYMTFVKSGKAVNMNIVKRPILMDGEELCKEFVIVKKEFNKRPKETKNTVAIEEVHRYDFFGWAKE